MQYHAQTTSDGGVQYFLSGQLTAQHHEIFRGLIKELQNSSFLYYTLHLGGLQFIDSGGLGMFLLANDICKKQSVKFSLIGVQGNVLKILQLSHFDKIMSVDAAR